jgi:hypothetical protein
MPKLACSRIAVASKAKSSGEVTADEAVAAVKDGRSEKRTIVQRRMSADEIEVSRLDALAERELEL